MYYRSLLLGVLALSPAAPALGQSDGPIVLDPVVVTSTRLDQTAREAGSSVTVITAEDIEAAGYVFAVEALAAAPGVTINTNGAFGGTAKVRIRGASTDQTLVLVDGIPVNDPTTTGGGFDFSRVDARSIERIEVLKGPQSTIWGSHAIGGVVSIITKRASSDAGGSAFGEYGSFRTLRTGVTAELSSDSGDLRVHAVRSKSDGISKADEDDGNSENDPYESLTLSLKGGVKTSNGGRGTIQAIRTISDYGVDGFAPPAFALGDTEDESSAKEFSGSISLAQPSLDGQLENLFVAGHSEIARDDVGGWRSEGKRQIYRYQGTYGPGDGATLGFGGERETQSTESDTGSIEEDSVYIESLFALGEFKPMDALTLTGGLRRSKRQQSDAETTGRAAAAWDATDSLTLRASWGQGFKAPTIYQTTYFGTTSFVAGATCTMAPNADLEAETSTGVDVGADFRFANGRGNGGVTFFQQDTENQIGWDSANCNFHNIDRVESSGIEINGSYRLALWLTASANFALISAEDETGEQLVEVPEQTGQLTLRAHSQGPWSGSATLRHNGDETAFGGVANDAWTRLDVAAAYQLSDSAEVYLRVENLLDADYQQVLDYGTPGRSGMLGLRVRF